MVLGETRKALNQNLQWSYRHICCIATRRR